MVYDFSWVDQHSFLAGFSLGFVCVLIGFFAFTFSDLIGCLSRWIYEKAFQLRKDRIGDQPSLVDRIRKKFFPPDDAA